MMSARCWPDIGRRQAILGGGRVEVLRAEQSQTTSGACFYVSNRKRIAAE